MMAQHWMLACKLCGFTGDPDQSYIFVIFQGCPDPLSPPLDPDMEVFCHDTMHLEYLHFLNQRNSFDRRYELAATESFKI